MTKRTCSGCSTLTARRWCSTFCRDVVRGVYTYTVRPAACIVCEARITQPRHVRYFCSKGCQEATRRRPPDRTARPCEWCHVSFCPAGYNPSRQRFCSPACRYQHRDRRWRMYDEPAGPPAPTLHSAPLGPPLPKLCIHCTAPVPGSGQRKRCVDCLSPHTPRGSPLSATCGECGNEFRYASTTRPQIFCSDQCRQQRKRRNRPPRPDWGKNDRKRARHYGVAYEPVRRPIVYERDNWICQICTGRIHRTARAPHPKSASLDHIVPMSLGGPHLYSNVQAAHFECNWQKGAGLVEAGEQLRLIG